MNVWAPGIDPIDIIVSVHSSLPFFISLVIVCEVLGMIYSSKGSNKFWNSVEEIANCYHYKDISFEIECDMFINTKKYFSR